MTWIKLTGKQQIKLKEALRAAYATEVAFDEFLLLACDQSLDDLSASRDEYPVRVLAVVKRANSERWVEKLIASARQQRPNDPTFKEIEDELKTVVPVGVANPFAVSVLSGGHIMVDRAGLRAKLQDLYDGTKRILV